MFNIIETPRNYFTHKLLHDNLSSNVAFHFNVSHWRPYLVVSCLEELFCRPNTARDLDGHTTQRNRVLDTGVKVNWDYILTKPQHWSDIRPS